LLEQVIIKQKDRCNHLISYALMRWRRALLYYFVSLSLIRIKYLNSLNDYITMMLIQDSWNNKAVMVRQAHHDNVFTLNKLLNVILNTMTLSKDGKDCG
jgi:hypothetical protein